MEVKCGSPRNGTNTESISITEASPGEAYNYTCTHGFTSDPNNLTVVCQLNDEGTIASWSLTPSTCSEVKCGSPENGTNTESVSITEGQSGEAYNYTCSHGFTSDPNNLTVVCELNAEGTIASWSLTPSTCSEVKCGSPGNGTNTESISITEGSPGEAYNYTCSHGFTSDPNNLTVVCQLNDEGTIASWSQTPSTCSEVKCGSPENGTNTESISITEASPGEAYNYTCSHGFTSDPNNLTVVCQLNDEGTIARWSLTPSTCSEVKCGSPENGTNTESVSITEGQSGEAYNYTCSHGFTSDPNNLTVVCQLNDEGTIASWSLTPSTCSEVKCGSPGNGTNTESISITEGSPGEAYHYTCSHGFTSDPNNLTVVCQLNDEGTIASWSQTPSTCSAPSSSTLLRVRVVVMAINSKERK
ncbi:zona pellucida sperm-binding protein 3 receptor-like [Strongylocentrotus purpuratus]|uniref:Sushi domain-containing protein n=1 Tax=Strongylocentrotus purpuratus TaxID=7668 RepID=A0A7M7NSK9_STRPU|nr:zona pellucida sperm-binding protein 3 receptor-like [Strongylocentrotus purpuratus]